MTIFLFLDGGDHVIAMRHSVQEADRFERHTRNQEPEKQFLRLEIAGATLVSSVVLKPEPA